MQGIFPLFLNSFLVMINAFTIEELMARTIYMTIYV
jgi:hypothetical protein